VYTVKKAVEKEIFCNVSSMINWMVTKNGGVDEDWAYELFYCSDEEGVIKDLPLSFYAVSDRLAAFLREKGHPVTDFFGVSVWGRPTYGQLIECDYVIQEFVTEINDEGGAQHAKS
tara:strand:+ start:1570 stop:1917 length:348 start_codon:yes stop_codon:yes gene_type:complete